MPLRGQKPACSPVSVLALASVGRCTGEPAVVGRGPELWMVPF